MWAPVFVIKHLRTTRKEKSNKTGRVVSHWSARVATVLSQTGDAIDGTWMSEIPAKAGLRPSGPPPQSYRPPPPQAEEKAWTIIPV